MPSRQTLQPAAKDLGGGFKVRHLNFVSSRKARIRQARDDWRDQRFGSVPGETEFIPLP